MPGKWDGKSRPVNNKYRENYDDIFKKKTIRVAGSKTVNRSSVRVGSKAVKKRQSDKKNNGTVNRQTLER
jgi:hypothetical protein